MKRLPLLAGAMVGLILGLWSGLLRIGVSAGLPAGRSELVTLHGPLMVLGFLLTLIALERAVASGRLWTYAAPVASGAAVLAILMGFPWSVAAALEMLASGLLVALFFSVILRHRQLFHWVMGVGALCAFVGNALWWAGLPIYDAVYWWMGFLLLTIAGERLELTRLLEIGLGPKRIFAAGFVGLCVLLLLTTIGWEQGARGVGLAMVFFGLWLLRYDIARRTLANPGLPELPRFIAVCLLSGNLWLVLSGALLAASGPQLGGFLYDAFLHAFFLGFVFSMIFGHAPVIFPAVLGLPVGFSQRFYLHWGLLHGGLLLRVVADLIGRADVRAWAGSANALAILFFIANTVLSVIWGERERRVA